MYQYRGPRVGISVRQTHCKPTADDDDLGNVSNHSAQNNNYLIFGKQ